MKKIYYSLLMAGALLGLSACSEDTDSNPVLDTTKAYTLVLNTPAAAPNNVYDLQDGKNIILTASQPDYGFPVSTAYTVEMSLDNQNWTTVLNTVYTPTFTLSASDVNAAVIELNGDQCPEGWTTIYVRANATINDDNATTNYGACTSNVVTLTVDPYAPEVTVSLPTSMYIVGGFPASNGWSVFVPLHAAYSADGIFYDVVYMEAGSEFKINPDNDWKGNDKGYGQVTPVDEAGAGYCAGGTDVTSNMKVTNAGWYTVVVKTKIKGDDIDYTVTLKPAKVYIIGNVKGGDWNLADDGLFTAPADANGEFTSPAFTAAGEIRVAIDCGIDWWKTELTLYNGSIFYRNCDIPNNWSENVGADYSHQGAVGGHIYLNFTTETGRTE